MAPNPYVVADPLEQDDDQTRAIASIMSPTPAAELVGPPPDMAPPTQPGMSTQRTGNLAAAPQQAVAKNMDTMEGRKAYSGGLSSQFRQQQSDYNASPAGQAASAPAPLMPASAGASNGLMPAAAPSQNAVQGPAPTQLDTDTARLNYLKNSGSGIDQIQNKTGRVAARIGDTALRILAPAVEPLIGGTEGRHQLLLGQQQGRVENDQEQLKNTANIADINSQADERAAKAAGTYPITVTPEMVAQNPDLHLIAGAQMRPQDLASINKAGTTGLLRNEGISEKELLQGPSKGLKAVDDPDHPGKQMLVPDENSPFLKIRQTAEALQKARTDALNADPSTSAGRAVIQKMHDAESGHAAAMIRARASMISAKGGYFGTDENGQPLNGIGETPDGRPIGTHLLAGYSKAAGNIAKFQDVYSSIDNANAAIDEGDKTGAKFNTAKMAEALSDPKTTAQQWIAGKVNTTLNPQEQNIVITTKALREQLNAMRSSVGGGVSDAQVNRLVDQLPNATTPSTDYARKQLATVRGQLDRLQGGLPGVNNGPGLRPAGSPATPTSPGGVPSHIPRPASALPPEAARVLQEGKIHTFNNGQQWTKQNGQAKRIK